MTINVQERLATTLNHRDEIPNRNIQAGYIMTKQMEKSKQMEALT